MARCSADLFSGMDLLTARGCLPSAPQYVPPRYGPFVPQPYVLLADFPTGDPACFGSPACIRRANESASMFFQHWASLGFSRQSTNLMRRAFAPEVDGHRVGVLPALLLCLHLVHQPVTSVRTEDFTFAVNGSGASRWKARRMAGQVDYAHLQGSGAAGQAVDARAEAGAEAVSRADDVLSTVSVHTASGKVSYLSALFRLDAHERPSKLGKQDWPSISKWARGSPFVDAQLGAIARAIGAGGDGAGADAGQAPGRMFVSVFKAAPHWILRNGWMARWVLDKSQAVVQDETGLRPHFFNASASAPARDGWTTSTLGRFTQFENRETRWYPGENDELRRVFSGPKLPFKFGYAQDGNPGVMLLGWRDGQPLPRPVEDDA